MAIEALEDAIARTNASQKPPVVFIHGLWLKPSSWDRWVELFEAAGYAALAPGWPAEAGGAAAPETIGELVTHFTRIVDLLNRRPAIVGHAFGGLIAQALAGHGISAATVAIDPAPFRGGDTEAAQRGPLLVISGERDNTAPPSVAQAAYEKQKRNPHTVTEFVQFPGRGHSLTIDRGWEEVAQTALAFLARFLHFS